MKYPRGSVIAILNGAHGSYIVRIGSRPESWSIYDIFRTADSDEWRIEHLVGGYYTLQGNEGKLIVDVVPTADAQLTTYHDTHAIDVEVQNQAPPAGAEEPPPRRKLAIDVGGVLIAKKHEAGPDTNFSVDNVQWLPGALEAVDALAASYEISILSFCGKKTEEETRVALGAIRHVVPEERWIFTRKREHKVREMKKRDIPTLVDDRLDIVEDVRKHGLAAVHFGSDEYPDWATVSNHLLAT